MTTRSIAGTLMAAAVAVLPCATALAAPDEAPKPPAEVANLKVFDGSWTCEGTVQPSPMGPGGKMSGTVKSHTDLGGHWQSGVVKSTMAGMPPMEGMFHMTYDPGPKQYVLLWVDNMGAYSHETASGWQGDTIVFTGDTSMAGKAMKVRDTFVKAADGSLKHDMEAQIDGKWMATGTETCKKAGPAKK
jgi:Protein of unknown function (DUF1579)